MARSKPKSIIEGLEEARTVGEGYNAVVRAFAHGKLDVAHAKVAVDLIRVRSTIVAAEEYRRRLELIESESRLRLPQAQVVGDGDK